VLRRADVVVHASVIPEPFGQVVLEGMAAGLPVIATASGGPLEVITDRVDGLLVAPNDVGAMADAMRRVRASPELREDLGSRGRERAAEFGADRVATEVLRLYESVRR
jgi:glycosyltransferase involved in cell wall biosynthesis